MDIKTIHSLFLKCTSVTTDSRKIDLKSLFIALKGPYFDANTFVKEALRKGASYAIIDNKEFYIDEKTILVEDSLKILHELASYHRKYLGLTVIALTGSNGKTTTKELLNVVLSKKYNTKATVGNLNNHIGVPLTLLSFTKNTEIGIVEMGANHQKEIELLCNITSPDFGYITNFGKAHLDGFGGFEGVIKGKSEMYNYLLKNNKTAFINADDPIQVEKTISLKKYSFGNVKTNADLLINNINANPFVTILYNEIIVNSHLVGLYNANNITAAITIGKYFKIDDTKIKEAIESYIPNNNRSQILIKSTNKILLDAYNANPSSMSEAIENLILLQEKSKMMILGDMFELGTESITEHYNIISRLTSENQIICYFVGDNFYQNKIEKSNFRFFKTFEDLALHLKENKIRNSTILIKGSRGMALEKILNLLP